ncbi:myosin-11-like isoform X2 [Alosa sapidissima]|uniref:myosin-11-like isoform X2 n=1 Tax=Alosa sapidissima TaxID=34773 RepID=UPI001C08D048|nr:myosin-11-like isoform X2 [Alosa sapidissima]
MLRRTVSQPIGLDRVDQLGSCMSYTSMQNLTAVFARSRSSLMLDNDCTPIFYGQESQQWENEELGWQAITRCRALGYEGPDHDEIKVSEECNEVYIAEEEEVWNSSDLSLEEKRDIVELLHCKNRFMKRNADLQKALDACEDSNTHLEMENSALKSQVKSMKQSIQDAEQLMEEMDVIRGALADSEAASSNLKACISKLEKENKALINQIETVANEMSKLLPERESDKEKITNLTQHIKALQQQLEETRMLLDEKTAVINSKDMLVNQLKASLEEFATMEQTLKRAVKDLEGQLELARVTAGGSFLNSKGLVLATTDNCFSLAEELGLMPGHPESDDEVEVDEPAMVEEEKPITVEEEKVLKVEKILQVPDEPIRFEEEIRQVPQAIIEDQKEVHREVSLENDIEEVKYEQVDRKVGQEMQEVTKSLDEEGVEQAETVEEEQIGFCVAEQEDTPQHPSVHWLGEAYHSFRRGVLTASAFSLGVVLPLSVVSAALPPYHSGSGLGCSDFFWSTARQVLGPYCTVQNIDMPPS